LPFGLARYQRPSELFARARLQARHEGRAEKVEPALAGERLPPTKVGSGF
jgi:hypothetical protein